jgi:hypothetical protein
MWLDVDYILPMESYIGAPKSFKMSRWVLEKNHKRNSFSGTNINCKYSNNIHTIERLKSSREREREREVGEKVFHVPAPYMVRIIAIPHPRKIDIAADSTTHANTATEVMITRAVKQTVKEVLD